MSQYENFSFATFDYYFMRFQVNTVCNLLVNSTCIYLILRKSTPSMGYYKYYILLTVVTAMLMDFHISFIFGPYIFIPQPITCATGLVRFFNYYFGSIFNYVSFISRNAVTIEQNIYFSILCTLH